MKRVAFSALSLVLFLGLLEGGARVVGPGFMPEDTARDVGHGEALPNEPNLVGDEVTGWRALRGVQQDFGVPAPTEVNSRGLRDSEIPVEKPPGERRVLLLGDSTVYGVMVSDAQSFGGALEASLKASGESVEVLNGGCPGYSSWQALQALKSRLLDYQPDLVVVATLWSDAQGASNPDSARFGSATRPLLSHSAAWVLGRSALRRYKWERETPENVEFRFAPSGGNAPPPPPPGGGAPPESMPIAPTHRVPIAEYRVNLRAIAATVEAAGGEVLFLALPSVRDVALNKVGDFRDAYREVMREVAEERSAPMVEAGPLFFGGEVNRLFFDDVHPTARGHRMIADLLAENLQGWLESGSL